MSTYRFQGVPLTGGVFAQIALELVDAPSVVTRSDLMKAVAEHHVERGGLEPTSPLSLVAKKGLADLQTRGKVERAGAPGYWRFLPATGANSVDEPVRFGSGDETVYVYYLPAYRDQAAHLDRNEWPMKIGMTKGDAALRIKDQIGTALPERPTVGLLYKTDDAVNAERILHSTLRARERHLVDAPGKEWFMTSLQEVKEILDFATSQRGGKSA